MKILHRLIQLGVLVPALIGSAAVARGACDNSTFSGRYGLHGDGWGLVNFQGQEEMFPVAIVALLESDGAGNITHWREFLVSEAQHGDDGSVIHDGTLSSSHHETFDSITYQVQPDCTMEIEFAIDDYRDGVFGVIVDGGSTVMTLSEKDGSGNARDIAAGTMRKLDDENGGIVGRVEALAAKVDEMDNLLKLIARRLSIVVE